MSDVETIIAVQKVLGRYGLSALIIFGNIGNLLNMAIFARNLKRQLNSCTCYMMAASFVNWILLNTTLISSLYGVDNVDPQHGSLIVCKLRWYGGQILLMLSRSFMISACIDRWASTSSKPTIRKFSQPKVAICVILGLIPIWAIIPIHMAVHVTITAGRCGTPSYYAFAFGMYLLFVIGLIPPFLLITFGCMALRNLRLIRRRVANVQNPAQLRFQKADHDLMRMVTGEVIVYLITTLVYPANVLYGVVTRPFAAQKSPMRVAIENLVGFIISPLLNYIYCAAPFYIYALSCKRFRKDFVNLFRSRRNEQNQTEHNHQVTLPKTNSNQRA